MAVRAQLAAVEPSLFPTQEGAELYRAAWRLWQAYTTEMQIPLT
ncbi:hypothetical protein [Nocardia sp. NPDC047648]